MELELQRREVEHARPYSPYKWWRVWLWRARKVQFRRALRREMRKFGPNALQSARRELVGSVLTLEAAVDYVHRQRDELQKLRSQTTGIWDGRMQSADRSLRKAMDRWRTLQQKYEGGIFLIDLEAERRGVEITNYGPLGDFNFHPELDS